MPRIGLSTVVLALSLACGPSPGDGDGDGDGASADADDGASDTGAPSTNDAGTSGVGESGGPGSTTSTTGAVDVTCAEAAICVAAECPLSLWYEDGLLEKLEMDAAVACAIEKCGAEDYDEGLDAMWAGWDFFSCNDDSDEHDNDHYNPHDTGADGTAD